MINHPNRSKKAKTVKVKTEKVEAVKVPTPGADEEVLVTYKGFDSNMQCRGFQYSLGATYEHKGPVKACAEGFHACENPLNMLAYYSLKGGNKFARVRQWGKLSRHDDTKIASAFITIDAEIRLPEIIKDAVKWALAKAFSKTTETKKAATLGTSGDYSTAGTSGYYSTAGTSGDSSTAGTSGYYSKAKCLGKHSCALSGGYQGRVMGAEGCALFLVYRNTNQEIIHAWSGIVGRDGIRPEVWYTLDENGKPVEA